MSPASDAPVFTLHLCLRPTGITVSVAAEALERLCAAAGVGSAVCRRVRAATVDVLTACAGNSDVEVDARISRGELALDVKGRPAAGARWATACPASVRAAMDTVETPAGRAALRLRKRVGGNAA